MKAQRSVTYLLSQASKTTELKSIQEKISQIHAICFNRETLKLTERLEGATNPGLLSYLSQIQELKMRCRWDKLYL